MNPASNDEVLKNGTYAKKQIFSSCNILRWSHQARFRKGQEIVSRFNAQSIMDYGCGDGTFLYFVDKLFRHKIGMDIDPNHINNLQERFKDLSGFRFLHTSNSSEEKFDIVTCFEVLEHCTDENIDKILNILKRHCQAEGHVVISVPKETGLTMIGKQLIRRILALRRTGNYEYSEWYTIREFFKFLFAFETTQIKRHFYEIEFQGSKYTTCGHKGFNWKTLKPKISKYFVIEKIEFSPDPLPFGLAASQVWFTCRLK